MPNRSTRDRRKAAADRAREGRRKTAAEAENRLAMIGMLLGPGETVARILGQGMLDGRVWQTDVFASRDQSAKLSCDDPGTFAEMVRLLGESEASMAWVLSSPHSPATTMTGRAWEFKHGGFHRPMNAREADESFRGLNPELAELPVTFTEAEPLQNLTL